MATAPTPPPEETGSRPNPYRDAGPFGIVEIGGVVVPGILQSISGCVAKQEWNFQKAGGGGGVNSAQPGEGVQAAPVASGNVAGSFAISVWRGALLAEEIEIVSDVSREEDYDAAIDFIAVMMPRRGRKPPSHSLVNPEANAVGITRCAIREIGAPVEETPGSGKRTFKFKICEYKPQKTAPAGKADPAKPSQDPKPADAAEVELNKALDAARAA